MVKQRLAAHTQKQHKPGAGAKIGTVIVGEHRFTIAASFAFLPLQLRGIGLVSAGMCRARAALGSSGSLMPWPVSHSMSAV